MDVQQTHLVGARGEGPGPQLAQRVAEAVGQRVQQLGHGGLLAHAEHAVVRALGVVQVVALVAVERLLQHHVHVHVQVRLVALLAPDLRGSNGDGAGLLNTDGDF